MACEEVCALKAPTNPPGARIAGETCDDAAHRVRPPPSQEGAATGPAHRHLAQSGYIYYLLSISIIFYLLYRIYYLE